MLKLPNTFHGAFVLQNSLLNKTVLIAESDADFARRLESELTACSASVEIEVNGSRAIDRALNVDFDLLILAANLPIVGGAQVLSLCKQHGIACPAIALVDSKLRNDPRVTRQILDLGFAAVVDYGFDFESLHSAILAVMPPRRLGVRSRGRWMARRNPRLAGQ